MLSGSQKPTIGLSSFASEARPALSEISPDVQGLSEKSGAMPSAIMTLGCGARATPWKPRESWVTASIEGRREII